MPSSVSSGTPIRPVWLFTTMACSPTVPLWRGRCGRIELLNTDLAAAHIGEDDLSSNVPSLLLCAGPRRSCEWCSGRNRASNAAQPGYYRNTMRTIRSRCRSDGFAGAITGKNICVRWHKEPAPHRGSGEAPIKHHGRRKLHRYPPRKGESTELYSSGRRDRHVR